MLDNFDYVIFSKSSCPQMYTNSDTNDNSQIHTDIHMNIQLFLVILCTLIMNVHMYQFSIHTISIFPNVISALHLFFFQRLINCIV